MEVYRRLMARQNRVMAHWAPAHRDVAGNEGADDLAKKAAEGPPVIPRGPSQARRQVSPPAPTVGPPSDAPGRQPSW